MRVPADSLDDLDRAIVAELARDGRVTSTALATSHGISPGAAAARVRRLIERRIVRVTVAFDVDASGYEWQAICYFVIRGRSAGDVAADLAAHPRIWHVSSLVGRFDLVAAFMFVDKDEMTRVLTEELPQVAGIAEVECDVDARSLTFRPPAYNAMLHDHGPPELIGPGDDIEFPAPVVDLDNLDRAIINRLRVDGRRSNRDIGRDLDVSEGTVRQRIKRLLEARLMKVVSWIDPASIDRVGHVFYIRLVLGSVGRSAMAQRLSELPQITVTTAVLGRAGLVAMCFTHDQRETNQLIQQVRSLDGVVQAELLEIVDVHYMVNHFIRIPPPALDGAALVPERCSGGE